MAWSLDARIPLRFGPPAAAGADDAFLIEGASALATDAASERFHLAAPGIPACLCCPPRNPAGYALGRLFTRRARNETAFFKRVLAVTATPEGQAAIRTALIVDPLAAARFRLET